MPNNNSKKVTFDEPGMGFGRFQPGPRYTGLVGFIIKMGLAKDDKQATTVLIVLAVVAGIGIFIFWPGGSSYDVVPQPGLQQNN